MISDAAKRFVDACELENGEFDPITGEWTHVPFTDEERQAAWEQAEHLAEGTKALLKEKPNIWKDIMGDVKEYKAPVVTIRID